MTDPVLRRDPWTRPKRCASCKALMAGTVNAYRHVFRGFAVDTCDSVYCRARGTVLAMDCVRVLLALRDLEIERTAVEHTVNL